LSRSFGGIGVKGRIFGGPRSLLKNEEFMQQSSNQ
jgi:hypothetical protein